MLPSASLSESGPELFELIHGSAPDIARHDKANPLAIVLIVVMLLKYELHEENVARIIESAVLETLNKGFRTGYIFLIGKVQKKLNFFAPIFLLISIEIPKQKEHMTGKKSTFSLYMILGLN
ncbi:hypothetical protein IFM89_001538 [Coptis chinensis]|uniref:Isopropylmalate dehydrogenase-like domain-containing protein n=1 Tax=Coptis chinensis TaxID=261450 RepID=A0A835I0K6_9MAGN|nr:hypothetical protein IFM89_001538 [Coptis chinensis]